ncbi:MAG: hypothetical protein EOO88_45540, partial [Pedobacter sp.]
MSIGSFDAEQYLAVKKILISLTHPNEVFIYYDQEGKKRYDLTFGKKKHLFLQALSEDVLKADRELSKALGELQRRYGYPNASISMDSTGMRWRTSESALHNPNFDKFNHAAWLASMRKIHDGYHHKDFMKGDILEHGRSFEATVEKNPLYFYDFIDLLFHQQGVSSKYISHGISALIKAKHSEERTSKLIEKEVGLELDREYTQYAIWHSRFLLEHKLVTSAVVAFWVRVARWEPHENDRLNPGQEMSDFINSPRGVAIDNLMHLIDYPEYGSVVFETIDYLLRPGQLITKTLSCGIMSNIAYLNHFDDARAFSIFQQLILLKDIDILKHSMNPAQYFNNTRHSQMDFYFEEILQYPELYESCYFFVSSWVFKRIDDYEIYDRFMRLGGKALKCAIKVAENLLSAEDGINERCIQVLFRCLDQVDYDLSREFSGLVLRKFKPNNFPELHPFIIKYVTTGHFAKDPRYLFEYLIECAAAYPCECLALLGGMDLPF